MFNASLLLMIAFWNKRLHSIMICYCIFMIIILTFASNMVVCAQNGGICGLIAATNIQSYSGYSQWSCTTDGVYSSTPCNSPVWAGITCNNESNIVAIDLINIGFSGKCSTVGSVLCYSFGFVFTCPR